MFEGSDIDIEDLLVAKYGEKERENIQRAVGIDSDYLATKAKLEQLSAERKAAYAGKYFYIYLFISRFFIFYSIQKS